MDAAQLQGMWLNGYIRDMLEERDLEMAKMHGHGGHGLGVVHGPGGQGNVYRGEEMYNGNNKHVWTGAANGPAHVVEGVAGRMGPTSRKLGGEMGGDTTIN